MSVGVDIALALGVLNLLVWALVVIMLRRLWRQLKPQVEPLLAMFMPAPDPSQFVDQEVSSS